MVCLFDDVILPSHCRFEGGDLLDRIDQVIFLFLPVQHTAPYFLLARRYDYEIFASPLYRSDTHIDKIIFHTFEKTPGYSDSKLNTRHVSNSDAFFRPPTLAFTTTP